jgi:hypothetical protein
MLQLAEPSVALLPRCRAQIFAIDRQQIERHELQARLVTSAVPEHCAAHRSEVLDRTSLAIRQCDQLAVQQRSSWYVGAQCRQ